MSKTVKIEIQGRSYNINTSEDESYLRKIAAQLDLAISDAVHSCPNTTFIEQLILIGLEQQDKICCLKKQISELHDKLEHYNVAEGLGCIADYRETISLLNQRADALQHENDSLHSQLNHTFETLSKFTEQQNPTLTRKDTND